MLVNKYKCLWPKLVVEAHGVSFQAIYDAYDCSLSSQAIDSSNYKKCLSFND